MTPHPPDSKSPSSATADPIPNLGMNRDGHPDNSPYANLALNLINEMLMEEDMEDKTCMLQDCLALQAAEKSFYEVLMNKNPCPPTVCENASVKDDSVISRSSSNLVDSLYLSSNSGSNSISSFSGEQFTSEISSRGRRKKSHDREENDSLEERGKKQSAFSLDDSEQSEMFDDVLLCKSENHEIQSPSKPQNEGIGSSRSRKNSKKVEIVDLWSLLTQCAQAVSTNDQRTATEILKQIRQHSSESGNGTQRLAHFYPRIRIRSISTPILTQPATRWSPRRRQV